eukprot:TRINITY_DN1549_c0_g2_i4.p2 TRINITY_DN1549_c0_g2~~TRINITY_DN1549_c0_g2_i4.p2  ORF type:complete len:414 (+),score=129.63 TRINITY_DN1549_c0_g2_i4:33-1244(+)
MVNNTLYSPPHTEGNNEQALSLLGELTSADPALIEKGDPFTMEFTRIKVWASKHFDRMGNSEVMVVAIVKHSQASKDRPLNQIVYFDDDVDPVKSKNARGKKGKHHDIDHFQADEYGHPVFFHTPGWQGKPVSCTIQVWEMDDYSKVKNALDVGADLATSLGGLPFLAQYGIAFSLAGTVLRIGGHVSKWIIDNDKLTEDFTFDFHRHGGNPVLAGNYVFLPDEANPTGVKDDYELSFKLNANHPRLVKKGTEESYASSYFVVKVSKDERDDLVDFDLVASSQELLDLLNEDRKAIDPAAVALVLEAAKDAYALKLLEDIKSAAEKDAKPGADEDEAKDRREELLALYRQLGDRKEWFDGAFPDIATRVADIASGAAGDGGAGGSGGGAGGAAAGGAVQPPSA